MEMQGHDARPTANQPGTLAEQFAAIAVFYDDETRHRSARDRREAWKRARQKTIKHARPRNDDGRWN